MLFFPSSLTSLYQLFPNTLCDSVLLSKRSVDCFDQHSERDILKQEMEKRTRERERERVWREPIQCTKGSHKLFYFNLEERDMTACWQWGLCLLRSGREVMITIFLHDVEIIVIIIVVN